MLFLVYVSDFAKKQDLLWGNYSDQCSSVTRSCSLLAVSCIARKVQETAANKEEAEGKQIKLVRTFALVPLLCF